ncbi:MAG: ArnT family glycosyltransferase [Planctomycetota bacterium]
MIVIQKLFGATPAAFYIWPFISSTVTAIFIYLAGARLVSKKAGIFASIIFVLYPEITYQGSSFMPTGTAAMYVSIAIFFLLKWRDDKKWIWLVLVPTAVFFGYGAKETTLFFLPGFLLYIIYYSYKGKWKYIVFKPAAFFLAVVLVLFISECLVFQKITTTPGGRFSCLLKGKHGNAQGRLESLDRSNIGWRGRAESLQEYVFYFTAYRKFLHNYNAALLNFGFLIAVLIFLLRIKNLYPLSFVFIPTYLIFTYASVGAFPFLRPEKINDRYYTACYALSILMFACLAASVRKKFTVSLLKNRSESEHNKITLDAGFILCLILTFFLAKIPYPTRHFSITCNNYKKVKLARAKEQPILMLQEPNTSQGWKYIKRYRAFYGDTKDPFYDKPRLIKMKDANNKESVFYILEYSQKKGVSPDTYLLTSKEGNFVWKQVK